MVILVKSVTEDTTAYQIATNIKKIGRSPIANQLAWKSFCIFKVTGSKEFHLVYFGTK